MPHALAGAIRTLKSQYGDAHSALWPATLVMHAGLSDPRDAATPSDVELDTTNYPGYSTATINNTSTVFPDPDPDTGVLLSATLTLCTASGDWDDVPTFVWFTDPTSTDLLSVYEVDFGDYADGAPSSGDVLTCQIQVGYPTTVTT